MAAVSTVSYAEFYRVVTNDPHNGDPSAIFEDKTPVHIEGVQATPSNIISAVCWDTNMFTKGGDGVPIERVLLQFTVCPRSQGRASSFVGPPIAQLEDVRLLGPTFVRLSAHMFYVKSPWFRQLLKWRRPTPQEEEERRGSWDLTTSCLPTRMKTRCALSCTSHTALSP